MTLLDKVGADSVLDTYTFSEYANLGELEHYVNDVYVWVGNSGTNMKIRTFEITNAGVVTLIDEDVLYNGQANYMDLSQRGFGSEVWLSTYQDDNGDGYVYLNTSTGNVITNDGTIYVNGVAGIITTVGVKNEIVMFYISRL